MSITDENVVDGNFFDKYRSTNVLHRWLVGGFIRTAKELLEHAKPTAVLEVGAGPGDLAAQLFLSHDQITPSQGVTYLGTDVSRRQIELAQARYPKLSFQYASAYELPFADRSFDLCLACEVFEHLAHPDLALAELARVCNSYLLISVPWEPTWRALNIARGKYVQQFGNTPGHIQHFSRKKIRSLVTSRFEVLLERWPFPWTMLLAKLPPT